MKNPTIWESASRPLFVRTVWLEGSELRRGLQRHFLWDFEAKRPLERLNSAITAQQQRKKESLNRSLSFDLNDIGTEDLEDFNETDTTEGFIIGSAKLKLHDPSQTFQDKNSKSINFSRRNSFLKRKYFCYDSFKPYKDLSRRSSEISELYSRKNSLHDLRKDTLDERLAERVLHWLNLKNKEEFVKNLNNLKEMDVKLSKTARLRQDSIKRFNNNKQQTQRHKAVKTKNPIANRSKTPSQANQQNSEAVKHITIIFNKEGKPIRFNRPVKNIDLCALSASPSATRRLAGTLASARLYKSAENTRQLTATYPKTKKNISARRRLDTVADLTNSNLQRRLHENPMQGGGGSFNNLHDAKKQLHIFMPTLPKKGLSIGSTVTSNIEDANLSELSHNFSELCRL